MSQPIIRGIQAVGAVDIKYRYNSSDGKMTLPTGLMQLGTTGLAENNTIDTSKGVDVVLFSASPVVPNCIRPVGRVILPSLLL